MAKARFNFYGAAREFAAYRGAEAIIHGPAETGKTLSSLWVLHLCALQCKDASIVIARKTQTSAYATVLRTFQEKVLGNRPEAWKIEPYGGQKPEWFDYPTGARIWVTGLDKAGKILSAEHDLIYVNQAEELELADWETLTTRTTGRAGHRSYAQTIGDANPAYPSHWMYHRQGLRLFYSRHEENPVLFDQRTGEITEQGRRTMAVLDSLTGARKQRLRYGKAAQAEGAIYTEWDESAHRIYRDQAPVEFGRYVVGVDWGYANPGAMALFGITGDGAMYLMRQIYRAGERDDWWRDRALDWQRRFGPIEVFPCDPSQPAYIDKFKDAGLNAEPANNDVLSGINAVKRRLDNRRLFVVRDGLEYADQALIDAQKPHSAEDEFPAYVWAGRGKEAPVKTDDHAMDAIRYAVMYVDDPTPAPVSSVSSGVMRRRGRRGH